MISDTYRELSAGLGDAVAARTILRNTQRGGLETWGQVADRVALGNSLLVEGATLKEYLGLRRHIASGTILMSGRHLQHGDRTQPERNMEVFSNCSTAATSSLSFYLLLNGSGVGRAYYDSLMKVDWGNAPEIHCCLDIKHPDYHLWGGSTPESVMNELAKETGVEYLRVGDSREGWAKAVERWEVLAYKNPKGIKHLVLDFSEVREKGAPIGGMQNRPASGPHPLMEALVKSNHSVRESNPNWLKTMYVDHYLAECVLVGGARRAARMAVKYWKDRDILTFIHCKANGDLWSANNSVGIDAEFRKEAKIPGSRAWEILEALAPHARATGEPGTINLDKLEQNPEGLENFNPRNVGNDKFQLSTEAKDLLEDVFNTARDLDYYMIVNPCGEVPLAIWGAFCIIADVVPYHAKTLEEAEDAFRHAVRATMRVNCMDSIYAEEVRRTNRIGIGMTGVFEFAWKFFGLAFRDLIDETKGKEFWDAIARFRKAALEAVDAYAKELGLAIPHTVFIIKPAGTTSKLFSLSEGWHLPSRIFYLRWTQFRSDDPLVREYIDAGYPHKELVKYPGTTVIGFPTELELSGICPEDQIVTAAEATPEEQYQWLKLGEKYWIGDERGGQISYTLKYYPNQVSVADFTKLMVDHQFEIKCCSVMPHTTDDELLAIYEYMPEESISLEEYRRIKTVIENTGRARMQEDLDKIHVDCDNGACPVDFSK